MYQYRARKMSRFFMKKGVKNMKRSHGYWFFESEEIIRAKGLEVLCLVSTSEPVSSALRGLDSVTYKPTILRWRYVR